MAPHGKRHSRQKQEQDIHNLSTMLTVRFDRWPVTIWFPQLELPKHFHQLLSWFALHGRMWVSLVVTCSLNSSVTALIPCQAVSKREFGCPEGQLGYFHWNLPLSQSCGYWSFLSKSTDTRVVCVRFTSQQKNSLNWVRWCFKLGQIKDLVVASIEFKYEP